MSDCDSIVCFRERQSVLQDLGRASDELKAARAELVALRRERDDLRQRAEDAELLLRAMFDAELNSHHPLDWYFKDGHTIVFPGRFTLSFDRERGLPVLTDEARAALRKDAP